LQGVQILRNRAYMEPHSQACGIACYAHTGDILNKEHLPTAKPVVLCVKGEQYAAVMKDEMNFLRSRHIWILEFPDFNWQYFCNQLNL